MSGFLGLIDWPVLTRQILLIVVPMLVARGVVPESMSGPLVEAATYVIGTVIVGYVVWRGQRRERPDEKIAAVAELPVVREIRLTDPVLAIETPSPKVRP